MIKCHVGWCWVKGGKCEVGLCWVKGGHMSSRVKLGNNQVTSSVKGDHVPSTVMLGKG